MHNLIVAAFPVGDGINFHPNAATLGEMCFGDLGSKEQLEIVVAEQVCKGSWCRSRLTFRCLLSSWHMISPYDWLERRNLCALGHLSDPENDELGGFHWGNADYGNESPCVDAFRGVAFGVAFDEERFVGRSSNERPVAPHVA